MRRPQARLWDVWSRDHGVIVVTDLLPMEWAEIQEAAKFVGVSGRRADELVANEDGRLYVIDSCGEAHAVAPVRFIAVPANTRS